MNKQERALWVIHGGLSGLLDSAEKGGDLNTGSSLDAIAYLRDQAAEAINGTELSKIIDQQK